MSKTRKTMLLLILVVWVIGIMMIWLGGLRIDSARREAAAAEARNAQATLLAAGQAWDKLQNVQGLIKVKDFNSAKAPLNDASNMIDVMKLVAPTANQEDVKQADENIKQAVQQLTEKPDEATQALDKASEKLYGLSSRGKK